MKVEKVGHLCPLDISSSDIVLMKMKIYFYEY